MNMVKLLKIGYLKLISQQYEQQYLFFVYIKIACITKGIMFYILSYDSQCHVGKWSYFHKQKQNCSTVLLILTFGLQKWLMEGDVLPSTL